MGHSLPRLAALHEGDVALLILEVRDFFSRSTAIQAVLGHGQDARATLAEGPQIFLDPS